MDIYNIALDEHAFWLADMLDPFARGLHADVSLFICTFSQQFIFFNDATFLRHNSYFFA